MQFRALSYAKHGHQESFRDVREEAVQYMENHKDFFLNFPVGEGSPKENLDSFIEQMKEDREWGDELTLVSLYSKRYNLCAPIC